MLNYGFYKTRIHILYSVLRKLSFSQFWCGLKNLLAFYLKLQKAGRAPSVVFLQITHHCNFSCIMCQKSSRDENVYSRNVREMDFQVLEKFLRGHSRYISIMRITGGEPFMYPRIDDLLHLMNELKIKYAVQTNGSLISPERADLLLKHCHEISFSIDSADEKTYAHIRRGGELKPVLENIKTLVQLKGKNKTPFLNIAAACFTFNIDGLPELVALCKELSVPTLSVSEGGYYNTPEIEEDHFIRNHPEQVAEAVNRAQKMADHLGITLRLNSPVLYFSKEENQIIANRNKITGCSNFFTSCVIQPGFEVKLCPNSEPVEVLTDGDLKSFWNSDRMRVYRQRAHAGQFPPTCRYCNDYNEYFDKHAIGYSFIDYQKRTKYWKTDQAGKG